MFPNLSGKFPCEPFSQFLPSPPSPSDFYKHGFISPVFRIDASRIEIGEKLSPKFVLPAPLTAKRPTQELC